MRLCESDHIFHLDHCDFCIGDSSTFDNKRIINNKTNELLKKFPNGVSIKIPPLLKTS